MKGKGMGITDAQAHEIKTAKGGNDGFKKGGKVKKRAEGGAVGGGAGSGSGGGAQGLKHGGKVKGAMAKGRPDKRARGGAVYSAANKTSTLSYQNQATPKVDEGGKGKDKP